MNDIVLFCSMQLRHTNVSIWPILVVLAFYFGKIIVVSGAKRINLADMNSTPPSVRQIRSSVRRWVSVLIHVSKPSLLKQVLSTVERRFVSSARVLAKRQTMCQSFSFIQIRQNIPARFSCSLTSPHNRFNVNPHLWKSVLTR